MLKSNVVLDDGIAHVKTQPKLCILLINIRLKMMDLRISIYWFTNTIDQHMQIYILFQVNVGPTFILKNILYKKY
jgi:hypothetical protein